MGGELDWNSGGAFTLIVGTVQRGLKWKEESTRVCGGLIVRPAMFVDHGVNRYAVHWAMGERKKEKMMVIHKVGGLGAYIDPEWPLSNPNPLPLPLYFRCLPLPKRVV